MPTRVFMLRHAESAVPNVFHGHESDVDLSERGVRQAAAIAAALADERPDIVISSAMIRARRTAEPIARACGVPHEIVPELHERKVGILSGRPFADNPIWSETNRRWSLGETSYAHEGAESLDQLRDRLVPAWERVTTRHAGRRIAIVCHGIVCRVLLTSLVAGLKWDDVGPTRNVAIHELSRDEGDWTLHRLGWLPPDFAQRELA